MKFISWNVNGLRACVQKGFIEYFNEMDADFFCVQETKLQEGQIDFAPADGSLPVSEKLDRPRREDTDRAPRGKRAERRRHGCVSVPFKITNCFLHFRIGFEFSFIIQNYIFYYLLFGILVFWILSINFRCKV